jgi:hypothetical protein
MCTHDQTIFIKLAKPVSIGNQEEHATDLVTALQQQLDEACRRTEELDNQVCSAHNEFRICTHVCDLLARACIYVNIRVLYKYIYNIHVSWTHKTNSEKREAGRN